MHVYLTGYNIKYPSRRQLYNFQSKYLRGMRSANQCCRHRWRRKHRLRGIWKHVIRKNKRTTSSTSTSNYTVQKTPKIKTSKNVFKEWIRTKPWNITLRRWAFPFSYNLNDCCSWRYFHNSKLNIRLHVKSRSTISP